LRKSLSTIIIVAIVSLGSLLFHVSVSADSLDELKTKEKEVQKEREDMKENLSDVEAEIADILIELKEINLEIERVMMKLEENESALKENESNIENTEDEINQLEEEIVELEDAIQSRLDILKDRASSYQKSGGNISYIEVLFGSKSFSEFISRITAVTKVAESDNALIEQIESDKEEIEDKQKEVTSKLDELNEMRTELEEVQTAIKEQENEAKKKQTNLAEHEEKLIAKKEDLEIEDRNLASIENEIGNKITALSQPPPPVTVSTSQENDGSAGNSSGTQLGWPTIGGYISSYMGQRWGRMHNGIDIARPSNKNILAAESGVIQSAGFNGGLGNRVEIQHNNGLKTLYGHLSSIHVTPGQKVSKGEVIGIMGSTGNSTGVHLHFEVYQNGSLKNPMDYLR